MLEFIKEAFSKDEDIDRRYMYGSPLPPFLFVAFYVLFVLKCGPAFMKNRKPFKLKKLIFCYNLFQIYICCDVVSRAIANYVEDGFWDPRCRFEEDVTFRTKIINGSQLYMLAKYAELVETVLFILRKKFNQVTFLHVYHHASQVIFCYLGCKFAMSENYMFCVAMNSFVHIVMYSYYALASLGPGIQKYLWWKKYITKLQLIQFVLIITDVSIREFMSSCPRNNLIYIIAVWQVAINIFLFLKFYKKAYKPGSNKAKDTFLKSAKMIN